MNPPVIGITMGDPAGVGPEIIIKVLADSKIFEICSPVVFGDAGVLSRAAEILGLDVHMNSVTDVRDILRDHAGVINVYNLSSIDIQNLVLGRGNENFGKDIVKYITTGIKCALGGEIEAVATAPINKEILNRAGYSYGGHTELFAQQTNTKDFVMMLAGKKLRVSLSTTHCGLKDVAKRLSIEKILMTITVTNDSLKEYFAISKPKIAVAAFNPHAGEGGMFGDEEERVLIPAICRAKEAGIDAEGPFPSDTLFYYASKGEYDAVVCMYHDQGLIPLKLLSFHSAVNVTLGLPIIRTSVDHGTAYDIAWTGKADSNSMKNAIKLAASMAIKKRESRKI